ncbi:serine hydrolase [Chryseobacterium geocarposphaerae]|uniref:CubicO group peptidase (Beta-lactamase class C family) n=1 Tax=Chryseobacterium geocarposphaerae TaxID=1416776 RepID=A0A2M9C9L3_9FLAO|nr:serine hydrolase [Chryseobacterium geocarposphaerae]PJJ67521.1 CubicO group peptidase (beta-lactamase class C family) [Chryseobacterium geocarposphaerae]
MRNYKLKLLPVIIVFCLSFAHFVYAQKPGINIIELNQQLKKLEKENYLSGVVLIAKNGQPIYKEAFGFANLADSIPNKTNTKFNLASMNKMFTAMAVLQLAEAGKVSLHDKVGKYLTDFPNQSIADSVTIHQLLTHTSGMGNFWAEHEKSAKEKFRTVADYLPLFIDQKLAFRPGSDFLYSNSGYMVLGLIIEKITGKSYFDFVKENIYMPAKMLDTDAYELDEAVPNLATGYTMSTEKPGQWKNNIFSNVVKGTPAGGGYSTADDLLKFANAIQNNILLNKESVKLYTTGKVKYREGMYAYGIIENIINGHRMIGHTGGHLGIANELMIFPDSGYTVVILTNGEVENYWEVSNLIKKQLAGSTPSIDNFFYTKEMIKQACDRGYEAAIIKIKSNPKKNLRENLIERYGYKLLFEKKYNQAIDLFKLNIYTFPGSAYGYYNISEAYRLSGRKDEAIKFLKIYIEKEPGDKEALLKYEGLKNPK